VLCPSQSIPENAVDVPVEVKTASQLQAASPATPAVVEEMVTPVRAGDVHAASPDSRKMNGGVPIISVSAPGDSQAAAGSADVTQPYDPNVTTYDDDEDNEGMAKSLEEQVMELEREVEQSHGNHVSPRESAPATQTTPAGTRAPSRCSCGKVFAFTFFSLFLTLTVSACVVMFSDIDHPLMNTARTHLAFLEPTRDFILHKYQDIVNRL